MKPNEQQILEEAQARVAFKRHFKIYLVVNLLTWLGWYFTRAQNGYTDGYWPLYSTLGWGFGVLMHYLGVYHNSTSAVEKEMAKIKEERGLD